MTKDFRSLLHLYCCSIFDLMPQKDDYNFANIFSLAKKQEIAQSVFLSVKKLQKSGAANLGEERFNMLNKRFLSDIAVNMKKTETIYALTDELEKNGIFFCLLKGDSIARLYAFPETRISSDVDILIDANDEKRSADILKNLGCKISKREKNHQHYTAIYNDSCVLEVHTKLYSATNENIIFKGKISYSKDYKEITLKNGRKIKTLSVYDNLVFLTAHFIKHFLNSGAGIRQVSDLLVYMNHYKNEIDFEKYFSLLKEINFLKLICTVMKIGNDYFNLEFDLPINIDDFICEKLLDDIEAGGVFGSSETRNEKFSKYLTSTISQDAKKYEKNSLKRIFPNASSMFMMYPFTRKMPYLLPIAYIMRIFKLVKRLFIKDKQSILQNEKTLEFLKLFDII